MRHADLTAEQQELLTLDFGDETEKVAQEKVATVQEMYSQGHNKIAVEIADNFDAMVKQAEEEAEEEEKEDKENKAQEEAASDGEKTAAASFGNTADELGRFIERGTFDGLVKLGSDRHGDGLHYLLPFMEEQVAAAGAEAALQKFASKMDAVKGWLGTAGEKAKGLGSKASEAAAAAKAKGGEAARGAGWGAKGYADETGKAVKGYAGKTKSDLMAAITGKNQAGVALPAQERARRGTMGALRAGVPLAGAGGLVAAGRASKGEG